MASAGGRLIEAERQLREAEAELEAAQVARQSWLEAVRRAEASIRQP
jgi:hypothetical protein